MSGIFWKCFLPMGLPRSIRADNDKLLVGAFWKRLMELMGVDMHYTSPASSRSNGGCERKNQEFNRQVRLAVARAGKDWVASPPLHEFAMNRRSTAHRAGHSPFMIDRGHEPRGLTDLMRPGSLERKPLDSAAALSFFHRRVHVAQEAVDSMIITQDEMARSQNRLHRGDVHREGDWVRMHKSHFSRPAARELESFKVKPNWVGPFRVSQVGETGNQVRADLAGVQTRADDRFNISAIKPSLPPEGHDARLVHERDRSQDGACAIQSVGVRTHVKDSRCQVQTPNDNAPATTTRRQTSCFGTAWSPQTKFRQTQWTGTLRSGLAHVRLMPLHQSGGRNVRHANVPNSSSFGFPSCRFHVCLARWQGVGHRGWHVSHDMDRSTTNACTSTRWCTRRDLAWTVCRRRRHDLNSSGNTRTRRHYRLHANIQSGHQSWN